MMLQDYSTLHEKVRGKIQSIKSVIFAWQWVMKNGIKVLQSIEKYVRVREEKMTQYATEVSLINLGVYMSLILSWDRKFQEV